MTLVERMTLEGKVSCIYKPGPTDPKHVIDITRKRPEKLQAVIYRAGGNETLLKLIDRALEPIVQECFSYCRSAKQKQRERMNPVISPLPKFSSPQRLVELMTSGSFALPLSPALIVLCVETDADFTLAKTILATKKDLHPSTRIMLVASLEHTEELNSNPAVVFDYWDKDAISQEDAFPHRRFTTRVREAVWEWVHEEAEQERFQDFTTAMLQALRARDTYTGNHGQSVAALAAALGRFYGLSPHEVKMLTDAGLLHDIGKVGVPDNVLLKPGKLEPAEFEIIKQHPVTALSLLGPVAATGPQIDVANMVRLHHERPDGKGYVEGVTLEQLICPKLWVLPVADAFDAMTSKRVYRDDMPIEKALAIVRENAFQPASDGTQKGQFHPQLAAAFVELINEGLVVFCDDLTPKASAVATWARPAAETTSPEIHA